MTARTHSGCLLAPVANIALPAWDRSADNGGKTDLSPRVGRHVALTRGAAAKVLRSRVDAVPMFVVPGLLREARIVERPYQPDRTTFACTTPDHPTRFYLEPGEILGSVSFGDPAAWEHDAGETDYNGRTCVRVRPLADGATDDMVIASDRRTYRIRLVSNPVKVTLACSWTHPGQEGATIDHDGRRLVFPGETVPRKVNQTGGRATRFILFPLGPDLRELTMVWADAMRPTKAWQLFQYRRLRGRAGIPMEWDHPPAILEAVVTRLLQVGSFNESEVRQYLPLPARGQPTCNMLQEMAYGRRRDRAPLPPGVHPTMDDMCDPFPFLARLPETCLQDADVFAEPPPRALRIAWGMGQVADHAALFCAVAPRQLRRSGPIAVAVQQVASLERMMEAAGAPLRLADGASVAAAIDHLAGGSRCAHLGPVTRHGIGASLMLVVRVLRRYIRQHDPNDVRGLGRLLPADPTGYADSVARLGALRRSVAGEVAASRKARTLRHAGRLSALEAAAGYNLEQVVVANRALTAAEADLGGADWIDVPVQTRIVDRKGRLRPGAQRCVWRLWDASAYLRQLLAGSKDPILQKRLEGILAAIAGGAAMAPIRQYRRSEGVLGSVPIEPYFVRCWRHGLMARPVGLPPRQKHKRHMVLRETKLPGYHYNPHRLLDGDVAEMDLWRLSARTGRTIAFLEPFEHALRFGHLGLSSTLENMSRTTAWIQQTQDRSGWRIRRLNKQPVAGFLAHDKQSVHAELPDEMTWFPVSSAHLREGIELAAMTCRRCGHAGGMLPSIRHLDAVAWKRPEPQPWLFQFGSEALWTVSLNRFLRFLLPGFGRLTFHDFRHLAANAAYDAGMPGWMISLCLNHGGGDLWLHYAELNARQAARRDEGSIEGVVTRSADARSLDAAA